MNHRELFGSLATIIIPSFSEEDVHDWRYDNRAYCHMNGGYYIHIMKRTIKIYVEKGRLNPYNNINDTEQKFECWREMLKEEYKIVNPVTNIEVLMPSRDHYLVTINTSYSPL